MPSSKIYKTVRQMQVGEVAYTAPWALLFYSDDRRMIWANTPVYDEPQGFSTMKVTRADRGFVIDTKEVNHKWEIRTPDELLVIDVTN